MIEVEAPDGSIIEFPDNTSPDVMRNAMRRFRSPEQLPAAQVNQAPSNAGMQLRQEDLASLPWYKQIGRAMQDNGQIGRNVIEGFTLGLVGDEVEAGLRAGGQSLKQLFQGQLPAPVDNYSKQIDQVRAEEDAYREANPLQYYGQQIAGGIASTPLTGGAKLIAGGKNLVAKGLRSAGVGAASGGLAGFNEGEGGLENRAVSGITGSVLGGLLGGGIPAVGAVARPAAGAAKNYWNSAFNPSKRALSEIGDVLKGAGIKSPADALARLEELGPTSVLADVSQRGQRLLRTLSDLGGDASERISQKLDIRAANRPDRLIQGAAEILNPQGKKFYGTLDEIARVKEQQASPLYEKAFSEAQPVDIDPVVKGIDAEMGKAKGGIKTALQKARSLLQTQDGNFDTSLEGLHQSKLALDDAIQSATKDSSLGNVARAKLNEIRGNLLKAMDASNPTYGEARSIWAGQAAAEDALETGRAFSKLDPEEIKKTLSSMDETSREAFKTGVMRTLEDSKERLSNALKTSKYANQLKEVFGNEGAFNKFMKRYEGERVQASTDAMRSGSRTAPSLNDMDEFQKKTGLLSSLLSGDIGGAAGHLLGKGSALATGLTNRVANELEPLLMARNPQALKQIFEPLQIQPPGQYGSNIAGSALARLLGGQTATTEPRQLTYQGR